MIMLLTHRSEIREELNASLHARGYETCVPAHRDEVRAAMADRYPDLIVLDLYLAQPSGAEVLRRLRQDGYQGKVIVLSGESMVSVLHDMQCLGLDKVVHVPAQVGDCYDFGELMIAIETALKGDGRGHHHARIARRAYELYAHSGYKDGHDVAHWVRAEREVIA